MNGYPNRNCNRQNSVGITSKLLARYPGDLFLGAYVEKMLLLFCGVPYASGTEFVLECSFLQRLSWITLQFMSVENYECQSRLRPPV